jgi:hypothetical protein
MDMSRATAPEIRANTRKIQLMTLMGDSKEEDPKSHQHPN